MKHLAFIIIMLSACGVATAQADKVSGKTKEPQSVAILLYQGVELLDFAGPAEVFESAGFKVYTVSVDGKDIISQRFVTVKPNYSLENMPEPDIIVLPGGNVKKTEKDSLVIGWIRSMRGRGSFVM